MCVFLSNTCSPAILTSMPLDISTTYVEHLRSKPSAPPTPSATPLSSLAASPKLRPRATYISRSPSHTRPPSIKKHGAIISEHTPLLLAAPANGDRMADTNSTTAYVPTESLSNPHVPTVPHPNLQTHLSHPAHHLHHKLPTSHPVVDFIEVLTNSPRICRLGLGHAGEHHHHHHHQHDHGHIEDDGRSTRLSRRHSAVRLIDEGQEFHILHDHTSIHGASPTVGRKRQIISILVRSFSLQPQTFDLIAILRSSN